MSHLRFNHVFSTLMLLAALSAWFSPSVSDRAQAQLQFLFVPVSKPVYAFASWLHDKTTPRHIRDDGSPTSQPRDAAAIIQENNDLRMQISSLLAEIQRLQEINADLDKVGDLRSRCVRVEVSGGDSGWEDSRQISGGALKRLAEGMPVICPDGVIGRLAKVGATNSRVQFITDKGNNPTVSFARIEKDDGGHAKMTNVSYPDCVASGQGNGQMIVINKPWIELNKAVHVNDWVMLNDKDKSWQNLTYRIGRVSAVEQQKDPKYGQIVIESSVDPSRLKDVMVVVK